MIDRTKTRTRTKADGSVVTELTDTNGREVTNVWVTDGHVYWDDAGAGTVHVGTAWEFAQWVMMKDKN